MERQYSPLHLWIDMEGNSTATIGITSHGQETLGDIVYLELPHKGQRIPKGEKLALIESVKTAIDLTSPFTCEILKTNESLENSPEYLNNEPEAEKAWICKVKIEDETGDDRAKLLTKEEYTQSTL